MDVMKLLDDTARNKLEMVEIIHSDYKLKIDIDYLVKKTNLSKFKVKGTLEDLQRDLEEENKSFFYINRGEIVPVGTISNLDILKLRLRYIKESILFKLYETILFTNDSLQDFTNQNFIGMTRLYAIRQELSNLLKTDDLKLKNNKIMGLEETIRLTSFNCYYYYFNGTEYPFSEDIKRKINKLIIWMEHYFSLKITNSERNKLVLFLSIAYLRVKQGGFIEKPPIHEEIEEVVLLKNLINKYLHLTENIALNEAQTIYVFMYINEIIERKENLYFDEVSEKIGNMSDIFIRQFERTIDRNKEIVDLPYMKKRITHVHEQLLLLPSNSTTFIDTDQIQFFEENYRVFHEFVRNFIEYSNDRFDLQLTNTGKTKLYFDYMFELIEYIPLEIIEEPIFITVDFSHGHSYSKFIAKSIKSFPSLNVLIEWRFSSKTDLYISDLYNRNLPYEQIIWRNPPDENDWEEFIDKIIELRSQKNERNEQKSNGDHTSSIKFSNISILSS